MSLSAKQKYKISPDVLESKLNKKLKFLQIQVTKKSGRIICVLPATVIPGRDDKWYEEKRKDYRTERTFQQEQKNSWSVYAGMPCITNYNPLIHHLGYDGVKQELPLRIGMDFGGRASAIILSQEYVTGNWVWHTGKTFLLSQDDDTSVEGMCEYLRRQFRNTKSLLYHPRLWDGQIEFVIDIAGMSTNPQGTKSKRGFTKAYEDLKAEFPKAKIFANKLENEADSLEQLDGMFKKMRGKLPSIILNPHCDNLKKFLSGYHFPDKKPKGKKFQTPEEDEIWIHQGDLWRYKQYHYYGIHKTPPRSVGFQPYIPSFNYTLET